MTRIRSLRQSLKKFIGLKSGLVGSGVCVQCALCNIICMTKNNYLRRLRHNERHVRNSNKINWLSIILFTATATIINKAAIVTVEFFFIAGRLPIGRVLWIGQFLRNCCANIGESASIQNYVICIIV